MESSERAKQTRSAEEMATTVREDPSKVDGCPRQGINVTVYATPWKAMLMFGANAGPVRNKAELQQFFHLITERMQRLYEIG